VKIVLHRNKCIGCGSCAAVCPDFFEMSDDGLSDLKKSATIGDDFILEADNVGCAKEAAEVCPVQIIEIVN
jgi:ferredoxin